jgi:hypothetical protein
MEISAILESPIFALVVCLLLGAVAMSGKFSQLGANICLIGVCFVGGLGIFKSAAHQPRLAIGGTLMLIGFCLVISHWIKPEEKPALQREPNGGTSVDTKFPLLEKHDQPEPKPELPKPLESVNKTPSPSPKKTQSDVKPAIDLRAYAQPDEPYPQGVLLGGIVWEQQYVDVRLDLSNGQVAIQNLDFLVRLDTSIAGVGQISQFPGITAFPAQEPPAAWLKGTTPDSDGKSISIPVTATPGMPRYAPVYRVQCEKIFANTVVHFVIASIAMNPPKADGGLPEQALAPRRSPKLIRIKGSYEIPGSTERYSLEFSYDFPERK